ncbi:hypothetical protein K4K56_003405 [Colletotrichum sp. SAR 10_98]|nr:hypothetical protein K4K56_003405 [Colletotrichum sp. SAR 10_98]
MVGTCRVNIKYHNIGITIRLLAHGFQCSSDIHLPAMRFATSLIISVLAITAQAAVANDDSIAMAPHEELVDRQN